MGLPVASPLSFKWESTSCFLFESEGWEREGWRDEEREGRKKKGRKEGRERGRVGSEYSTTIRSSLSTCVRDLRWETIKDQKYARQFTNSFRTPRTSRVTFQIKMTMNL